MTKKEEEKGKGNLRKKEKNDKKGEKRKENRRQYKISERMYGLIMIV